MEESINSLLYVILDFFTSSLVGLAMGLAVASFFNYRASRRMYLKGQQHYNEGLKYNKEAQMQYDEIKKEVGFWKQQTDQLLESRNLERRLN